MGNVGFFYCPYCTTRAKKQTQSSGILEYDMRIQAFDANAFSSSSASFTPSAPAMGTQGTKITAATDALLNKADSFSAYQPSGMDKMMGLTATPPGGGWKTFLRALAEGGACLPPPLGTAFDVGLIITDVLKGDYIGAVLSSIGLIPLGGDVVAKGLKTLRAGGKMSRTTAKLVDDFLNSRSFKSFHSNLKKGMEKLGHNTKVADQQLQELKANVKRALTGKKPTANKQTLKNNPGAGGKNSNFRSSAAYKIDGQQMNSVRKEFNIPESKKQEFHDLVHYLAGENGGRLSFQQLRQAAADFMSP